MNALSYEASQFVSDRKNRYDDELDRLLAEQVDVEDISAERNYLVEMAFRYDNGSDIYGQPVDDLDSQWQLELTFYVQAGEGWLGESKVFTSEEYRPETLNVLDDEEEYDLSDILGDVVKEICGENMDVEVKTPFWMPEVTESEISAQEAS